MAGWDDIPVGEEASATQAALMRLQLWFMGWAHQRLLDLGNEFRRILTAQATAEGFLDGMGYLSSQQQLLTAWQAFFREWTQMFTAARWQAGSLAFGRLALEHRRASGVAKELVESAYMFLHTRNRGTNFSVRFRLLLEQDGADEADFNAVFEPQLKGVMEAASARLYGDNLNLSQRIWRMDQQASQGIQQVLAQGISDGDSAWNIAKLLEGFLGAGQDCPRWTSTRLYARTKQQIADGDRTGLYSGADCAAQGVAYNALRLARNEIQTIHHMATDDLFKKLPWVEKEELHLSPSHPDIGCECEDLVVSGEDGTGVYLKGTISLPIHVQCLCYKTAVLMGDDAFVGRLRGWLDGTQPWGAMDDYASWLGVLPADVFTVSLMVGLADNLIVWLFGDEDALDDAIGDSPVQLMF